MIRAIAQNTPSRVRRELGGFLLSGICSSAVYALVLDRAVLWLDFGVVLATVLAFIISTSVSYLLNARLSFKGKAQDGSFSKFLAVTLVGFALNLLIMSLVLHAGGGHRIGIVLVLFVVPPINFLGHKLWSFRV